jgi:hypothetical protein
VQLTSSPNKIEAPGSSFASFGSVLGHVDLVLADINDNSQEIHLVADYVASVTSIG